MNNLWGFAKMIAVGLTFMVSGGIAQEASGFLGHAAGLAFSIIGFGLLNSWFSEKVS